MHHYKSLVSLTLRRCYFEDEGIWWEVETVGLGFDDISQSLSDLDLLIGFQETILIQPYKCLTFQGIIGEDHVVWSRKSISR